MIRITAPLHDGFAGGAVFGASGGLLGIATAAQIRGYGVVIPASIAWAAASQLLVSGTPRRGYIGVAVQPVELPQAQRADGRERALLVVGVTSSGPAESAGVNVGDLILEVDGKPVASSEELLDRLAGRKAGETIVLSTLRGGAGREASIVIGERADSRRSPNVVAHRSTVARGWGARAAGVGPRQRQRMQTRYRIGSVVLRGDIFYLRWGRAS